MAQMSLSFLVFCIKGHSYDDALGLLLDDSIEDASTIDTTNTRSAQKAKRYIFIPFPSFPADVVGLILCDHMRVIQMHAKLATSPPDSTHAFLDIKRGNLCVNVPS